MKKVLSLFTFIIVLVFVVNISAKSQVLTYSGDIPSGGNYFLHLTFDDSGESFNKVQIQYQGGDPEDFEIINHRKEGTIDIYELYDSKKDYSVNLHYDASDKEQITLVYDEFDYEETLLFVEEK